MSESARWRVFISSTSRDLRAERDTLMRALHQMSSTELNAMEYFGSRSEAPKDVCLREVAQADIYVGIFAHRYGHIDAETGRSMTELEYRQARDANLPCLIYLKDKDARGDDQPGEGDEGEDSKAKLADLKRELQTEHVVSVYKNPDQLATKVVIDLHNLIKERRLPPPAGDAQPTPNELRLVLVMHFDLEELKDLCFALGVNFDDLRGEGRSSKARELVLFMQRRRRLGELLTQVLDARPDVDWRTS
jgi:hypothetical protein